MLSPRPTLHFHFVLNQYFICIYIFPSRPTRPTLITLNSLNIIRNLTNYLPRLTTLMIAALSCLVWYVPVSGLQLGLSARDAWSPLIARTTRSCKLPVPQPSSKVKPHKFWRTNFKTYLKINPLKPELNPICYLLALLGVHHFLHVSRIRVKLLTFRLLMSYIWSTYSWCF